MFQKRHAIKRILCMEDRELRSSYPQRASDLQTVESPRSTVAADAD
jgi:hypothetical protein